MLTRSILDGEMEEGAAAPVRLDAGVEREARIAPYGSDTRGEVGSSRPRQ
jgi:hypothetical protein